MLINNDCVSALKELEANSIDALLTDPPAGISFMGKAWDSDKGGSKEWIAWMESVMRECLRVMKPGAHGLVWSLPRTSHWTATALEQAGFEIRDCITHLFGSGFPKSLNIEKAGAGEKWKGFGTALKPAAEFWWLVRRPLSEKTVAANVLKWGTGGINVDGARIEGNAGRRPGGCIRNSVGALSGGVLEKTEYKTPLQGRFPANLVLSCCGEDPHEPDCAVEMLDRQSGERPVSGSAKLGKLSSGGHKNGFIKNKIASTNLMPCDSGGASRFFYCAKTSPSERGKDNKHPTVKALKLMRYLAKLITPPGGTILDPFMGSGSTGVAAKQEGFQFVGVEREIEYFQIAERRYVTSSAP